MLRKGDPLSSHLVVAVLSPLAAAYITNDCEKIVRRNIVAKGYIFRASICKSKRLSSVQYQVAHTIGILPAKYRKTKALVSWNGPYREGLGTPSGLE